MSIDNPHPVIILIRGLPGSGKSYIAKALLGELGNKTVVMLDPDTTDYKSEDYISHTKTLRLEGVDEALHVYRFLRAKAYKGIADKKIIIWNQPFTNLEIFNKMVTNLNIQANVNQTILPLLVVEVEIENCVAKERVKSRKQSGGHGPSDNTFNRFTNDYRTFAEEGYNTVTVQGEEDVSRSVDRIMKSLNPLL